VSGAIVAAMVAGDVLQGVATALPVTEASGTQTGPTEHSFPIPAGDGVTIDRDTQVILVRVQQRVYAFNLACPHENTALRWRTGESRFQCPRHESKYQPDGTFISGRATRNMDRFAIKRAGGNVIVDLAHLYRSDQEQAQWAAAVATV
jgi:Rieske Fe-S protein